MLVRSLVNGLAGQSVAFAYRFAETHRSVIFHLKVNYRLNLAVPSPQGRFWAKFVYDFLGRPSVLIGISSSFIAMIAFSVLFDQLVRLFLLPCVSDSFVSDEMYEPALRVGYIRF